MIGNVGLPGWFVATRLRVSLKQPNLRGIPGSFGAIFSDVNRLDVCPVGYYNRRMTFLRGTGRRSFRAFGPAGFSHFSRTNFRRGRHRDVARSAGGE